ncbi:type II secretion system GspH family protein [bacterium]|nr:type II secretion system GspH family protein [bacterium]
MKKSKGFTLIELLVVIAIIAILSTVVMAGLNSARQKGRDARRVSDIKAIQKALDLFFDSCSGYPNLAPDIIGTGVTSPLAITTDDTEDITNCPTPFGDFLASTPANPLPGGDNYMYCGTSITTPPASGEDDLVTGAGAGECSATPSSDSYFIGFQLENLTGALNAFEVTASPAGIVSGGAID